MSKPFRYFLLLMTHLMAVVVGVAFAFWYITADTKSTLEDANNMLNQSAMLSRYNFYVEMQRANAPVEDYKKALITFVSVVDQAMEMQSPIDDTKILKTDKLLAYERLSRIEVGLGNKDAAQNYMEQAIGLCNELKWSDCSQDKINMLSEKLEQSSLFAASQ